VTHVLLLTLGTERVMHSFVCQEIGRESREIIRPCIRVTLAPRAVELEDNNCAAPGFRSSARRDVVNGPVNGRATRQRSRGVPQMERKSEWFSIQALRQNNAFRLAVREVSVDQRLRTHALRGHLRRTTLDCNDPWTFCKSHQYDVIR